MSLRISRMYLHMYCTWFIYLRSLSMYIHIYNMCIYIYIYICIYTYTYMPSYAACMEYLPAFAQKTQKCRHIYHTWSIWVLLHHCAYLKQNATEFVDPMISPLSLFSSSCLWYSLCHSVQPKTHSANSSWKSNKNSLRLSHM